MPTGLSMYCTENHLAPASNYYFRSEPGLKSKTKEVGGKTVLTTFNLSYIRGRIHYSQQYFHHS